MDATNNIATDLFYKIRSRFKGLKLGNEMGEITINPEEARFFDFDYMEGETPIGHVSISLAEQNSIKVYFSTGITESMDTGQRDNWYGFLKELRLFAKRRLMSFDTRDIAKDNLDRRDYEFLTQHNQPKPQPNTVMTSVGESIMSESAMYGSKTVSYQKLMDTRLIVKHSQSIMDDFAPGARSRNISALFVENADGERFKYPFNHLAGARAMQRHVANGGLPYDAIGESIIQMSNDISQLRNFSNYVTRNNLMTNETVNIVTKSSEALNSLREQIAKLSKQAHYESYKNNFHAHQSLEVPEEVVEDFTNKFTVRNFKEDIKSVFPVLYRLMQENTLGYDDIVGMTGSQDQIAVEETGIKTNDPFAKFETWAMTLGEASAIQSQDPEEQSTAIQNLQALVGEHFPAGVDGTNAIESLKGIIEDPELYKQIKEQAKQDPDSCVRGLVKDWLTNNAPETLEQLDFGDYVEEPAPEAVPQESLEEGGSLPNEFSLEYETENAIVEFVRGQDGTPQVTKVSIGKTDITKAVEDQLAEWATSIDADEQSPIQNGYFILDLSVEYSISGEYRPATWGYHGGEPEEHPEIDDANVYVVGNGTQIEIDSNALGEDAAEFIDERIWDDAESNSDDYYDDPYESVGGPNKKDIPAVQRKAHGGDWKVSSKDLDKEKDKNISHRDTLAKNRGMNVQEVAEFIHSFYDRESGTFPKGPEGVAVMVGKKFGEQAEQVARKMVERMAPQQITTSPELQELARIKQLSGM